MLNIVLAIIVSATIDSTAQLKIGDQTAMHITATAPKTEQIVMPKYDKVLIPGIEIINQSKVDTTVNGDNKTLSMDLSLTSFEDSLFYIPPIPVISGEDTFYSEGLTLNVIQPFQLDTSMAITDIKPIQDAPRWVWGTLRWILLALLLIGLGVGGYFLYRYIQRLKQRGTAMEPVVPLRPAEEVALERLDQIREEKLWQTGETKLYHTLLTDIIREYIGRRFDVHSTEKTSDETLRELRPEMKDKRELFDQLKGMLTLADLVKFAKWTTTPEENEDALRTAYHFVEETTPAKEEVKEDNKL